MVFWLEGLKTTYHALRPWLDLRIWKSKHFLMYNFSAADQSTAAGHEDLPSSTFAPAILTCSAFHFRSEAVPTVDLDSSGSFPTQGSLQLSGAPGVRYPFSRSTSHTLIASYHIQSLSPPHHPTPLTPFLLLHGPCLGH